MASKVVNLYNDHDQPLVGVKVNHPWSPCTKPGRWAVMYLCVRGIYFPSFRVFWTAPTVWHFFSILLYAIIHNKFQSNNILYLIIIRLSTFKIWKYYGYKVYLIPNIMCPSISSMKHIVLHSRCYFLRKYNEERRA